MTKEGVETASELVGPRPSKRRDSLARVLPQMGFVVDGIVEEDWANLEEWFAEGGLAESASDEDVRAVLDEYCWPLTDEERADLEEAEREIERGEVASDEEVARVFRLGRP